MNCSIDEDGPVDIDELMALHNSKMMGKTKTQEMADDPLMSVQREKQNKISGSQECVGSRIGQTEQNVRFDDRYVSGSTKDTFYSKYGKRRGVNTKNGWRSTYASVVKASSE